MRRFVERICTAAPTEQKPSAETAVLVKRRRRARMPGFFSLSIAGIIGFSLLLAKAFYYKLMIVGPELLFGSAIEALILFLLASVFFFNYPKFFLKLDRINPRFSEQA